MAEAKEVAVRFFEAMHNRGEPRWDVIEELVSPGYLNHEAAAERSPGLQGAKETTVWLHEAFSDLDFEIEDVISNGEKVVLRGVATGRHTGAAGPLKRSPVTNRPFRVQQIHIFAVANGEVTEHWACRDDLGHMGQLGLLPPPPTAQPSEPPS